jgi:hypothetical protein
VAVLILVIVAQFVKDIPSGLQIFTVVSIFITWGIAYYLSKMLTNWLEKKLGSLLEQEIKVWNQIKRKMVLYVSLILPVTIVVSLIIFFISL